MNIYINEDIDKNIWNQKVKNRIFYRFEWFYIIQNAYGLKPYYIFVENGEKFALIGSFLTSKGYISLPFVSYSGFYHNDSDTLEYLKEYLKNSNIEIDARNLYEDSELKGYVNPIATFESSEEFWKKIQPRFRSLLRKSQRKNLTFKENDSVDIFYKLYSIGMRNLGTPVHSKKYIEEIMSYLNGHIFTIYDENIPVGSMFCLSDDDTLAVLYAYTLPKYSKSYANYFLYLNVIEWMFKNSLKHFDMGRSTYNQGTYFFKRKFRPKFYLIKSKLNYSENTKLQLASKIWKKLPLPVANILGTKIRKYLP